MASRLLAGIGLVLALAACGPMSHQAPKQPDQPQPLATIAVPYVGAWAAEAALCETPAWRFEERGLTTIGGVGCDFETITPDATGYTITAICTAEAPPEPYTFRLDMTAEPRGMAVSGGPWGEPAIPLAYCGPATSP